MYQTVSCSDYFLPRNIWIFRPQFVGQMRSCLANDLDLPYDRIVTHCVQTELLLINLMDVALDRIYASRICLSRNEFSFFIDYLEVSHHTIYYVFAESVLGRPIDFSS